MAAIFGLTPQDFFYIVIGFAGILGGIVFFLTIITLVCLMIYGAKAGKSIQEMIDSIKSKVKKTSTVLNVILDLFGGKSNDDDDDDEEEVYVMKKKKR